MALLIVGFLTQAAFLVGFFTRKFDQILLVLFFSFFIGNYFIMDLGFAPVYILCLPLALSAFGKLPSFVPASKAFVQPEQ